MPTVPDATATSNAALRISLNVVLGAAVADAVFLVALIVAFAAGAGGAVAVLGPLYGLGFVYLLYLAAKGAMDRRWGWPDPRPVPAPPRPVGGGIGERAIRAAESPGPPQTPGAPARRPARQGG